MSVCFHDLREHRNTLRSIEAEFGRLANGDSFNDPPGAGGCRRDGLLRASRQGPSDREGLHYPGGRKAAKDFVFLFSAIRGSRKTKAASSTTSAPCHHEPPGVPARPGATDRPADGWRQHAAGKPDFCPSTDAQVSRRSLRPAHARRGIPAGERTHHVARFHIRSGAADRSHAEVPLAGFRCGKTGRHGRPTATSNVWGQSSAASRGPGPGRGRQRRGCGLAIADEHWVCTGSIREGEQRKYHGNARCAHGGRSRSDCPLSRGILWAQSRHLVFRVFPAEPFRCRSGRF